MITPYCPISTPIIYCPIPTLLNYYQLASKPEYRARYIVSLTQYVIFFSLHILKFKTQATVYHQWQMTQRCYISMAIKAFLILETAILRLLCINNAHNSHTC